jgi:hypothetical protein
MPIESLNLKELSATLPLRGGLSSCTLSLSFVSSSSGSMQANYAFNSHLDRFSNSRWQSQISTTYDFQLLTRSNSSLLAVDLPGFDLLARSRQRTFSTRLESTACPQPRF